MIPCRPSARIEVTDDVLRRQCLRAFHKVSAKKAVRLVVAYEPVWAIGTGKTATPPMASDAHAIIRSEAAESFGQEFAGKLRILYGGSVKPENAHALMSEEEIDGALVGGASLDPKSFAAIVKYYTVSALEAMERMASTGFDYGRLTREGVPVVFPTPKLGLFYLDDGRTLIVVDVVDARRLRRLP